MAKTAKKKGAKKRPAKKNVPEPEAAPEAAVEQPPAAPPASAAPSAAAPHLPAAPAAPPPRGLEDVDRSDMVIPRFALVQPTSEEGTPGMIRDAISGEEYEALEGVVLLKLRKGRVFFAGDDDPGEGVLCASDDRIRPAERIEHPVQAECAGCPMSQWATIAGKRRHPKCQETYTLLIAHDGMPYFMTFKSSAIKDVKKLITQIRLKAGKARLDAFAFEFSLGTEKVKFDQGSAFMPRFTNLKRVSADDYELYSAMYDSFAEQAPTFDEAPGEGDDDGDDGFAFGANAEPESTEQPGADE